VCALIQGPGGAGKTSLACQIGKWAMETDKLARIGWYPMLPVLIEEEVGEGGLVEKARGELQALIGEVTPIDSELFIKLLRKKKVLLIVDHFSELGDETRNLIRPREPDFPVAALVVTSRIVEEQLGNTTMLRPCLLRGNRISSFMEGYLARQGKADIFQDDQEYFRDCERLSRMVGDREITPLLAKLYLDQLVKSKEESEVASLPENIRDLMLRYVDELHPNAGPDVVIRTRNDAKIVAWQCLRENFYPTSTDRQAVLKELDGEDSGTRLQYLEETLRILNRELTRTRFGLDPLAEYLAAVHIVEAYKGHTNNWKSFLKRADEKPLEKISGFLLAVRDCCRVTDANIPDFVCDELEKRAGLGA
jgi:hypothetical protein